MEGHLVNVAGVIDLDLVAINLATPEQLRRHLTLGGADGHRLLLNQRHKRRQQRHVLVVRLALGCGS